MPANAAGSKRHPHSAALVSSTEVSAQILYRIEDPRRGYPATREELFTYDVVICSDIARSAFTQQQIDWTVELVQSVAAASPWSAA